MTTSFTEQMLISGVAIERSQFNAEVRAIRRQLAQLPELNETMRDTPANMLRTLDLIAENGQKDVTRLMQLARNKPRIGWQIWGRDFEMKFHRKQLAGRMKRLAELRRILEKLPRLGGAGESESADAEPSTVPTRGRKRVAAASRQHSLSLDG